MSACSIIIVAYHSDSWLPGCISSLASVLQYGAHLVLVDNTGNSLIGELDFEHFDFELIQSQEPLGFAAANNLALTQASRIEPTVAFLNQDTLSKNDWLSACQECLSMHPQVAAVTPLTRTYDATDWDPYFLECARKSEPFSQALEEEQWLNSFYPVPVIPAAAMVARTDVLQKVGPFDPIYGSYYEDYDLCYRIRQAGLEVGVCTSGSISHFSGSATSNEVAEKRRARWVTRNRVIFRQREVQGNRLLALLRHFAMTFPRGLLRSLLGRKGAKPAGPYLAAHWDLLKLTPRLVSQNVDQNKWQQYLAQIGWPGDNVKPRFGEQGAV